MCEESIIRARHSYVAVMTQSRYSGLRRRSGRGSREDTEWPNSHRVPTCIQDEREGGVEDFSTVFGGGAGGRTEPFLAPSPLPHQAFISFLLLLSDQPHTPSQSS